MIVKKLLVPFINNKILQQAEYCYLASASISEPGFDMLMSKLPIRCKMDIVTGLDLPTNPNVFRKILGHYKERVKLRIHTKSFFHANVYAFDLPYRKRIAFIGSGNFTMGGFLKNEELFYQINTEKEAEELKSWFYKYFEYGIDLTEDLIREYETLYPSLKEREINSSLEKKQFVGLMTGPFNWDDINFKDQYFIKSDYDTFKSSNALLDTTGVHADRVIVQKKLLNLHELLKPYAKKAKLFAHDDADRIVSSPDPSYHHEHKVREMWLSYGKGKTELDKYRTWFMDSIRLQVIIRQQDIGIWLMSGNQHEVKEARDYFRTEIKDPDYRKKFFELLKALTGNYWIEIAGEKRSVDSLDDENKLLEFTNSDNIQYYFIIGKTFLPGDPDISSEKIASTIMDEFNRLLPLYSFLGE